MRAEKSPVILLIVCALCLAFAAGLAAQLIEPTRSLEGASVNAGTLMISSEPPGLEVQVDGRGIGKTPIFSSRFPSGVHVLRIENSEIEIHLAAGRTTAISWFKGTFIELPSRVKPAAETLQESPQPAVKSKPIGEPATPQTRINDPFYWPLNPRGPIP
jgi:hypothetical protein